MKTPAQRRRWIIPVVATGAGAALLAGYMVSDGGPASGAADNAASPRDTGPSPTAVTRRQGTGRVVVSGAKDTRLLALDLPGRRATLRASGGAGTLRPGDVVTSAPSKVAPHGALFTVDKVVRRVPGSITVTTRSATVADALGDTAVSRRSAVSAANIKVKPLIRGVSHGLSTQSGPRTGSQTDSQTGPQADSRNGSPSGPAGLVTRPAREPAVNLPRRPKAPTPAPGTPAPGSPAPAPVAPPPPPAPAAPEADTAAGRTVVVGDDDLTSQIPRDAAIPLTTLRLGVDLPLPEQVQATERAAAKAAAWVEFTPELILQYRTDGGLLPTEAALGVAGRYSYGYALHGRLAGALDTGRTPLKIPFAEVDVQNTFWVGGIPLPVEAHLRYFYRLTADGRVSIDAEHRTDGLLTFAGRYVKNGGWSLVREAKSRTTGVPLEVTGSGSAGATIGVTGEVMLFGAVGAGTEFAPYLKGTAAVGTAPAWGLYAGLDLSAWLSAQLKIFGVKIWSQEWRLPPLHGEWRLAGTAER